ncbi:MAG: RNase P modulator RnpM [Candidatus Zipacnadales bacterium]
MRRKHTPLRRCVVCGEQRPKQELMRVVRTPEGDIVVGAGPKVAGRGAYICCLPTCLKGAADGRRVSRALGWTLPPEACARLADLANSPTPGNRGIDL